LTLCGGGNKRRKEVLVKSEKEPGANLRKKTQGDKRDLEKGQITKTKQDRYENQTGKQKIKAKEEKGPSRQKRKQRQPSGEK